MSSKEWWETVNYDYKELKQRITELEAQFTELEAQLDSQNDDLVLLNDENYCHRFRIKQLEEGIRAFLEVDKECNENLFEFDYDKLNEVLDHLRKLVTP